MTPKTIADLKIKWTFSYQTFLDFDVFCEKFKKLNPNIPNYNIISDVYTFSVYILNPKSNVKNKDYEINTSKLTLKKFCNLYDLMFELDFLIAMHQFQKEYEPLKLFEIRKYWELSSNFEIYLK